jgi:hypothetical protein
MEENLSIMGNYGTRNYSNYLYGFPAEPYNVVRSAVIEVYDSLGTYKAAYQIGSGDFLGCDFSYNESGCNQFTLYFSKFINIKKMDKIKIYIFDSPELFFTGVIRYIPIQGSTKQDYSYSGFGYNDYLTRINSEVLSYAATDLFTVVENVVDTLIVVKTPIIKNINKIDTDLSGITITNIAFNYVQVDEVLSKLKEIANSSGDRYVVGVDNQGEFFFRKKATDTKVILTVGKFGRYGITNYEPSDLEETRSKLLILRNSGVYYGSVSSVEGIDIFEEKITAPDIDDVDIALWAAGLLAEKEQNKRQVNIDWQIAEFSPMLLMCDGNVRVINNIPPTAGDITGTGSLYGVGLYGAGLYGGNAYTGFDIDDTLEIMEMRYTINDAQAVRNIQLGSVPIELDRDIELINKNIQDLRMSLGR